jgi:hypothetical protein
MRGLRSKVIGVTPQGPKRRKQLAGMGEVAGVWRCRLFAWLMRADKESSARAASFCERGCLLIALRTMSGGMLVLLDKW